MRPAAARTRRDLHHALAATLVSHPRCTLSELASGAGISRATLYRFAPTREAIDEALFAAGFERLEAAATWFDGDADAMQVLEQVTHALLADWELVTLLFARMMEEQQRQGDLHLLPERWAPIGERFEAFSCAASTPACSTSNSVQCGWRTSTGPVSTALPGHWRAVGWHRRWRHQRCWRRSVMGR